MVMVKLDFRKFYNKKARMYFIFPGFDDYLNDLGYVTLRVRNKVFLVSRAEFLTKKIPYVPRQNSRDILSTTYIVA